MKASILTSPHYTWGSSCDGWRLLDRPDISVIHEKMPSGTSEIRHFHDTSRQFFFILKGTATLEIEGADFILNHEGIEIPQKAKHRIYKCFSGGRGISCHLTSHNTRGSS